MEDHHEAIVSREDFEAVGALIQQRAQEKNIRKNDPRSLRNAAKEVGMSVTHSSVKRLLQNPHYLGDDFYPAIIDRETFDAFEVERQRREEALGRDKREKKTVEAGPAPTSFWMETATQTFSDPYQQAEYLYSLIEKRG
jgi:hypothetical protein